ncbi:hypothetical protein [Corynebacterium nasicanis]|uniref:Secreted protein n=1 Tax=Corynebacterium nasicanis TaxID=1448267 RepID=A0ABW1Q9S0_9CORY
MRTHLVLAVVLSLTLSACSAGQEQEEVVVETVVVTEQAQSRAQPTTAAAAESDLPSFTGTVREKSTSEVMKGRPAPNGEPESNRYYILELDAPVEFTARSPGSGPLPRTISEVSLGSTTAYGDDSATWLPHVNQRVTVIVHEPQLYWPSDTGLPLGMLGVGRSPEVIVL